MDTVKNITDFKKWLNASMPNDKVIYHSGFAAEQRDDGSKTAKALDKYLSDVYDLTRLVHLIQNKISAGGKTIRPVYEYIAVKI